MDPRHDRRSSEAVRDCRCVLVVDDDYALCTLLADCLELAGYRPVQAHDGLAGWRAYEECRPDLAVVDLNLPTVSGFRLLQLLRGPSQDAARRMPLVIISGDDPQEASEAIAAARPQAYLKKPFGVQHFLATVDELLNRPAPAVRVPARL